MLVLPTGIALVSVRRLTDSSTSGCVAGWREQQRQHWTVEQELYRRHAPILQQWQQQDSCRGGERGERGGG
jgi:hypothetical protein